LPSLLKESQQASIIQASSQVQAASLTSQGVGMKAPAFLLRGFVGVASIRVVQFLQITGSLLLLEGAAGIIDRKLLLLRTC